ncbi:MAG: DUF91 domain-containing protein [Candidatus Heimdallarchaeota archaeon]|nr:DUF91 domain-containing protein [Candidatus Heimdallarchaeota archaeon]
MSYTFHDKKISEKQLEDLLRRKPELIEDGLLYITNQLKTIRGPLDVLFMDSNQTLVVAELKVTMNDRMLTQALDYFNFVFDNREKIARLVGKGIDPEKDPRLLLIAPDFSKTLLDRCKWLNIQIEFYKFRYKVAEEDEKIDTLFIDEKIIAKDNDPIDIPTMNKHFERIKNKKIRDLAEHSLDVIHSWDEEEISSVARINGISIKVSGSNFGFLCTRQKYIYLEYKEDKKWYSSFIIETEKDLEEVLVHVKKSYEEVK